VTVRRFVLILFAGLAGCGGAAPEPPGSPANPLVAQAGSGEPSAAAGYQALVERQSRTPRRRFAPCNLVTRAQAQGILGARVQAPLEAPQGPTCIYRSPGAFVTLAVQSAPFAPIKRRLRDPRRIRVAGRTAYCGFEAQAVLYVPLAGGRTLSVGARCPIARRFAAAAVRRLGA
jgi:hypothetical protein